MKLPLKKDDSKYSDWGWIRDADGKMIAVASLPMGVDMEKHRREKTDPTQERVDYIIRAVNCRDELVEALEETVSEMESLIRAKNVAYQGGINIAMRARAALAKAGKGEG